VDPLQRIGTSFPAYHSNGPFGGPKTLPQLDEDVNVLSGRHDLRLGGSFDRLMDDVTFEFGGARGLGSVVGGSLDNLMPVTWPASTPRWTRRTSTRVSRHVAARPAGRHNRYNE